MGTQRRKLRVCPCPRELTSLARRESQTLKLRSPVLTATATDFSPAYRSSFVQDGMTLRRPCNTRDTYSYVASFLPVRQIFLRGFGQESRTEGGKRRLDGTRPVPNFAEPRPETLNAWLCPSRISAKRSQAHTVSTASLGVAEWRRCISRRIASTTASSR